MFSVAKVGVSVADKIATKTISTIASIVPNKTYRAIINTPPYGIWMRVYCGVYTILTPENRLNLATFVSDHFPEFLPKYKILETLCYKNPENKDMFKEIFESRPELAESLSKLGFDIDSLDLNVSINEHFSEILGRILLITDINQTMRNAMDSIFETIRSKKDELLQRIPSIGGTQKKKKRRMSTRKNRKRSKEKQRN